jgi:FlaA1/EpsC-like NDP-sugar epimerase
MLVADIRSRERMRNIFEQCRPQVVFHAAAHKHVPLMEVNPAEAILNNVFGTKNLVELSVLHDVELFLLISSDKAVKPSSVMGATKRLSELLLQNLPDRSRTRFACVRFGNVMSSRGSVIPLFQRQIASGGPITITDSQVTRYFMTIPEAVQLVIQAGVADRVNGTTYVLDMGAPVRIVDLAKDLIELSGLRPDQDIQIETVGLRPGEKLHEELLDKGEILVPTDKSKILAVRFPTRPSSNHWEELLDCLWTAAQADDCERLLQLLEEADFGFHRNSSGPPLASSRSTPKTPAAGL